MLTLRVHRIPAESEAPLPLVAPRGKRIFIELDWKPLLSDQLRLVQPVLILSDVQLTFIFSESLGPLLCRILGSPEEPGWDGAVHYLLGEQLATDIIWIFEDLAKYGDTRIATGTIERDEAMIHAALAQSWAQVAESNAAGRLGSETLTDDEVAWWMENGKAFIDSLVAPDDASSVDFAEILRRLDDAKVRLWGDLMPDD